ncbi:MAG: lactate utilization protein [Gemmatimonadaceae bacterium]|nr:lactate utilization protein [Gemmatimonadaceae bacterium]
MHRQGVGHPEAAAAFLRDDERAAWHDDALWFVRQRRDRATDLPEWEALREAGSALKAHAMSRLAELLVEFERRATASGVCVHWARDAAEHNAVVRGILRDAKVKRVAKSKSMLTEECGLNSFLEADGIEVVDTDLGERIVQLAHQPPSHIVLPAIHWKKEEIGALFHREMGTPAGESSPDALAAAARVHLRDALLNADAAITGANALVAETGGVVVCTNEGNADLGMHSAPVHIVCVGIEKIIATLDDLGVLLRILARSATGQPITAYTTHVSAPRPGAAMHVVLVDNGRTARLADADMRSALHCIRCGACLNTCPIYRRSGGYSYGHVIPGPIGAILAPAVDLGAHRSLPFASTLCGSCGDVCPVKIDIPGQLLTWRERSATAGALPGGYATIFRQLGRLLSRPVSFARAGWVARSALRTLRTLRFIPGTRVARRWNPWTRPGRDLPLAPRESFREWARRAGRIP